MTGLFGIPGAVIGGQVATHALMANKTTVTTSENGKTTTTNGHS